MKTADAVKHFKTQAALAKVLGITPGAVSQWGEDVPPRRAYELEDLTDGALRANPGPPPAQQSGCNGHDYEAASGGEGAAVAQGPR